MRSVGIQPPRQLPPAHRKRFGLCFLSRRHNMPRSGRVPIIVYDQNAESRHGRGRSIAVSAPQLPLLSGSRKLADRATAAPPGRKRSSQSNIVGGDLIFEMHVFSWTSPSRTVCPFPESWPLSVVKWLELVASHICGDEVAIGFLARDVASRQLRSEADAAHRRPRFFCSGCSVGDNAASTIRSFKAHSVHQAASDSGRDGESCRET